MGPLPTSWVRLGPRLGNCFSRLSRWFFCVEKLENRCLRGAQRLQGTAYKVRLAIFPKRLLRDTRLHKTCLGLPRFLVQQRTGLWPGVEGWGGIKSIRESPKYIVDDQLNIWGFLVLKLSVSYGLFGTIVVKYIYGRRLSFCWKSKGGCWTRAWILTSALPHPVSCPRLKWRSCLEFVTAKITSGFRREWASEGRVSASCCVHIRLAAAAIFLRTCNIFVYNFKTVNLNWILVLKIFIFLYLCFLPNFFLFLSVRIPNWP